MSDPVARTVSPAASTAPAPAGRTGLGSSWDVCQWELRVTAPQLGFG